MKRVRLLPEAQADLLAAARFYERQRQALGREFIRSLDTDIQALGLQAGIHPRQYDCHRKLASRFPFAVYYRVQAEQVVVFASPRSELHQGKIEGLRRYPPHQHATDPRYRCPKCEGDCPP